MLGAAVQPRREQHRPDQYEHGRSVPIARKRHGGISGADAIGAEQTVGHEVRRFRHALPRGSRGQDRSPEPQRLVECQAASPAVLPEKMQPPRKVPSSAL